MDLVKYIYHEKQEPGSQLCAQHCLNNLLQQPVYTEIDLAELASKLDQAEHAARHRQPDAKSYNFDDTGFFSISVLEKALQVWDLTLVRWRGEAMRQHQDHPEDQAGFILNLQNHWFTLRRFKFNSRWYNLNSFLPQPEWISPTYLQLVLAQAEAEGYHVFVIRKAGAGAGENAEIDPGEAAGWGDGGVADFPSSGADLMVEDMGHARGRMSGNLERPSVDEAGPSAQAGPSRHAGAMDDVPAPSYSTGSGRRQRRQQDPTSEFVEEQDLLPGSGAETPGSASRTRRRDKGKKLDWRQEQDRIQAEFDAVGADAAEQVRLQRQARDAELAQGAEDEELDDDDDDLYHDATAFDAPTDFKYHNRSYDDEDEALQAALKASMADLPPGFEMPELQPLKPAPVKKQSQPAPEKKTAPATRAPEPVAESSRTTERWRPAEPSENALQDAPPDTVTEEDDEEPVQELTPAQIRQARLARFQQQQQEQQEARDRPAES